MFPLVHYFVNSKIYGKVTNFTALGAIWPDLAAGSGWDRDKAHYMGYDFYNWCLEHEPDALDLARGVISHGNCPPGVDYYADEYWPGCVKGWCFAKGTPYMHRVGAATRLPQRLWWWKSHNFVEMSYELITDDEHPHLKELILEALADDGGKREAARILSKYCGAPAENIHAIFCKAPQIFALRDISPKELAFKQAVAFAVRHDVHDADTAAMAQLLQQISEELREGYHPYMERVIELTGAALSRY